MKADDLDFEAMKPLDFDAGDAKAGLGETPMSAFIAAIAAGDMATAEAQITDDIEWGLMPYNKVLKGKREVLPWLKAASSDQKKPTVITNAMAENWGVFEYWNIGIVSKEVIQFGNEQGWPWPKDPNTLLGQKYRVAQCFVYHLTQTEK